MELVNPRPPPPPPQHFPTHRPRFKTPLKYLKSQVIGQEICLNVNTNASFEWCTLLSLQFEKKKMLSSLLKWVPQLERVLTFLCRQNRPVMIFAETLLLFLWKISELTAAIFVFVLSGSLSSNRWTCTEMLSGMKAMTGPICRARNLFFIYKKHYYVPFYFANEKIFYAEDRAKMNRELNLFVLVFVLGNWISGAADRTRQHHAVTAFITIISRVNFDPCKWRMTARHMEIHLTTNRCSLSW